MRVSFLGTSHAAVHLAAAARAKGFELVQPELAEVLFVSEDTPTSPDGERDLQEIAALLATAVKRRATRATLVLTSAVPPGFCRKWAVGFELWHQAETLRMRDAGERALHPEMLIVGSDTGTEPVPTAYEAYLNAFRCPVLRMTFEEAEFAKVAINMTLAAQVENTNRLAAAAAKAGANWARVAAALRLDSRIGPKSYLTPGRWQDSRHLLRDWRTLGEIEGR